MGLLKRQRPCIEFHQFTGDVCYVNLPLFSQPSFDPSFHLISMKNIDQVCICDVKGWIETDINISGERAYVSRSSRSQR